MLVMFLLAKVVRSVVFGQLRTVESDHLYERSWFALTEILLAVTIFRDGASFKHVFVFTALLIIKGFHWITQDRVDYMEHIPNINNSTHLRLQLFIGFLFILDTFLAYSAIGHVRKYGRGVMILFSFEFVVLASMAVCSGVKYMLNMYNNRQNQMWENKSLYTFYLDLVHDMFKLICYLTYFVMIMSYYGLPFHIIRDLYLTSRSLLIRVRDLVRYRRATSNMDVRYPNATQEDFQVMTDTTCIICREEMELETEIRSQIPKRLPCNHIFHFGCLRSWLERQQSCPTCRRSVLEEPNRLEELIQNSVANAVAQIPPPPPPPQFLNTNATAAQLQAQLDALRRVQMQLDSAVHALAESLAEHREQ